jgi:predicted O-methyltransferase YrrM
MKTLERLFFRRPRLLDVLHQLRLVHATSQTNEAELEVISRYARGALCAVEIGTYQGVSASRIAASLDPAGILFCVDPWPGGKNGRDPNFAICQRHLRRTEMADRVRIIRGFSGEVASSLPAEVDFAFIDGNHSWDGIETDWNLLSGRIRSGGFVCLHDTAIPPNEPWRMFDSVRFYDETIAVDRRFESVEQEHSLRVVRKL